LFTARYQGSDAVWRNARWDLGHLANATVGKEWYRERSEDKVKAFGINGRLVWTGGYRAMEIDAVASEVAKTTVFDTDGGFQVRQSDYFRFDLRVYWKRSLGARRNSTFAMDFQNVTGQKNMAYRFYDPFTKKIETKYQLEFVPNLSWRLEF
jgi:outer membrane receptor protein involved in Fe transport